MWFIYLFYKFVKDLWSIYIPLIESTVGYILSTHEQTCLILLLFLFVLIWMRNDWPEVNEAHGQKNTFIRDEYLKLKMSYFNLVFLYILILQTRRLKMYLSSRSDFKMLLGGVAKQHFGHCCCLILLGSAAPSGRE